MEIADQAKATAQTALERLVNENELDTTWTVTGEYSLTAQGYTAIFRRLDPETKVETAQISIDFDPAEAGAIDLIMNRVYEWAEMSGGR
ncbi:MAG: hypothetical protein ABIP75_15210 [Pyrinomonadaceae bacterium]